jgi:hypothetical protein
MQLYSTISGMERVLVTARVSPSNAITWALQGIIYGEQVVVLAMREGMGFSLLQGTFHWEWARDYTSTFGKTTLRYSPSDCFENFPFPKSYEPLEALGENYHRHRQSIMLSRQEGLTKTYNRFHNPEEDAEDIEKLRKLHVEMDHAVAAAYGWTDLVLGHGFHETKQGVRYTLSELARMEVLDRLLALNHERYEEEVRQGLHDTGKTSKKKVKASKKSDGRELSLKF